MSAVRFVTAKGTKPSLGSLHIACHVKAGASHKREGIITVTEDAIDLTVSAQAKEGEANKAVRELIAEVSARRLHRTGAQSFIHSDSTPVP
jgi:uncharacterized protein